MKCLHANIISTVVLAVGLLTTPMASVPQCQPSGPTARLPELSEASGLAASRRVAGRLWAHNDSGRPILFALDTQGHVTGRLRVAGAALVDWEAIGVGACPAGSCLYIGDIGDNTARRQSITIYRLPEPAGDTDAATVSDVFHATYPDGAHDAETLLVSPSGDLFVVTKGSPGAGALYRFPRALRSGAIHRLELVGSMRAPGKAVRTDLITDGSVSGDGEWVVLRTRQRLAFYKSAEFFTGVWHEASAVDLRGVGEPQGEAVAFAPDGSLFVAGEGGGKTQPGTLAHLTCSRD
jgi:hypothetical protein